MSNCTCQIDAYDDYDAYPKVFRKEVRTARKDYTCYECQHSIVRGEKHEYSVGLYENRWEANRTCMICAEIRDCYFCSYIFGSVWEDMHEFYLYNGDFKVCMLDKLSPDARQVMIDWVDDVIEDYDQ